MCFQYIHKKITFINVSGVVLWFFQSQLSRLSCKLCRNRVIHIYFHNSHSSGPFFFLHCFGIRWCCRLIFLHSAVFGATQQSNTVLNGF